MHIIPVVDLQQGTVVRALRGMRSHYRPIVSALVGSADPLVVAQGLCEHCATDTLYLADLDAIQGGAVQQGVLLGLLRALPRLKVWLDAGFATRAAVDDLLDGLARRGIADADQRVTPVHGSESLASAEELARCFAPPAQALLSLDSLGGRALDPAGVLDRPEAWPERLIVMTLDRVGSAEGPDLAALAAVRQRAPRARLIGAGGIRDAADLARAAEAGAEAWLVASALHDGRIGPVARGSATETDCRAGASAVHTLWQAQAPLSVA